VPLPFAPFIGLALGAAFAWLAAAELSRDEGPISLSRPFAIVTAFAVFVWLPVVGYFITFHGDWSYLYVVPWRSVPSAIDLLLVLIASAAIVGSFWLAAEPLRKRHFAPALTLIAAPGVVTTLGVTVAAHRLAVSGTFAQFHGGFGTEPIGASTLGKGVLVMGAILAAGIAWTVTSLMSSARP
jgi:hypothetical protein